MRVLRVDPFPEHRAFSETRAPELTGAPGSAYYTRYDPISLEQLTVSFDPETGLPDYGSESIDPGPPTESSTAFRVELRSWHRLDWKLPAAVQLHLERVRWVQGPIGTVDLPGTPFDGLPDGGGLIEDPDDPTEEIGDQDAVLEIESSERILTGSLAGCWEVLRVWEGDFAQDYSQSEWIGGLSQILGQPARYATGTSTRGGVVITRAKILDWGIFG